jgi:hypothetical protein
MDYLLATSEGKEALDDWKWRKGEHEWAVDV